MNKPLAILSVVYENYAVALDFISALEKQTNKNFYLYLADLSNNKKSIKANFPITIINSTNHGYAHGINLGIKKALSDKNEFFCIINNDTYFQENFVDTVLNSILHHPSSILGGKIYYAPNFEYHKTRYKKTDLGHVLWYAGGRIDWNSVITPHRGVDEIDHRQYDRYEKTEFVTGCLMILDKQVINRIGLLDESYFLYYEDADYCERAKRKNINLFYDPSIVVWHKNAQSTDGAGSKTHQNFQRKSRLKFGLRYAPLKTKIHLLKNNLLSL